MKHIILSMAFCGLFNITHAMQKDMKAEREVTVLEISAHDEFGGMTIATKVGEVIVPLTPDASPKSQNTQTPHNSVEPTPATSPKRLVTFDKQIQVFAALPKPKAIHHVRSYSAPVVASAAAACAHAGNKPLDGSKK